MTPQQKRALTLALNAYFRAAKSLLEDTHIDAGKRERRYSKAKNHVFSTMARMINGRDARNCTCTAKVDITFMGHLPDCPLRGL